MLDGITRVENVDIQVIEEVKANETTVFRIPAPDVIQYLTCDCRNTFFDYDGTGMYCSKCGSVPVTSGNAFLTPEYNIGETLMLTGHALREEYFCVARVLKVFLRRYGDTLYWEYELRHLKYLET